MTLIFHIHLSTRLRPHRVSCSSLEQHGLYVAYYAVAIPSDLRFDGLFKAQRDAHEGSAHARVGPELNWLIHTPPMELWWPLKNRGPQELLDTVLKVLKMDFFLIFSSSLLLIISPLPSFIFTCLPSSKFYTSLSQYSSTWVGERPSVRFSYSLEAHTKVDLRLTSAPESFCSRNTIRP